MKLQQLRYICEVARQGLNLSAAAEKLHTSQPGVSKQIRLLEDELGVEIFVRHGKRFVEITPPGRDIIRVAERMLRDATNLKNVAQEFTSEQTGSLTIATTHTQARYALPPGGEALHGALPRRAPEPAPGQPHADRRAGKLGGGRPRHRHRGDRALLRARDAALLRVEPLRRGAARASPA